jgi:uncharacterized glyoxalase superfamily protein PhnB
MSTKPQNIMSTTWASPSTGGTTRAASQASQGGVADCLLLIAFRESCGNTGPILFWLNLDSKADVDDLCEQWKATQAKIVSEPEDKPWKLHEFTAADPDGNLIRVFYDFRGDLQRA